MRSVTDFKEGDPSTRLMRQSRCRGSKAGECAGEQEKFWPYHDRLRAGSFFDFADGKLKAYARELGLAKVFSFTIRALVKIPVGKQPHHVGIFTGGRRAYVAHNDPSVVTLMDAMDKKGISKPL